MNLQELCDWNKDFSLSRIFFKIWVYAHTKVTECYWMFSLPLLCSVCACVCNSVSAGENQCESSLLGMKWELEEQWVGNLGPKVKDVRCLTGTKGLHQAHPWKSVFSFIVLTGGQKMWFPGVWPEESQVPTGKLLSPCNRIQKNPSLSLVLRSWWTSPLLSSSWGVSPVMYLVAFRTSWQAPWKFLNVLCWLVFACAEGTSYSEAQYLNYSAEFSVTLLQM